jgi:hypothetical protein
MAAAAQGDGRPSAQAERSPFLIHDLKIPFDTNRPVVQDGYLGSCHKILRKALSRCR